MTLSATAAVMATASCMDEVSTDCADDALEHDTGVQDRDVSGEIGRKQPFGRGHGECSLTHTAPFGGTFTRLLALMPAVNALR